MKSVSLFILALVMTSTAFAAPRSNGPVVINPTTLRTLFLSRNIDVAVALNEVQQAKAQVSVARGNLLPSINLGAMVASGPTFMLTTVSFLLPFLMPSNWMDLRESKSLLQAQGTAYYLAQLNGYASAYSLYMTVVGDMQLRDTLQVQYENFKAIEDQLRLPAEVGMIRKEDYLQAQAQASLAKVQVSQLDELIVRERAAIRQMLGLSLNREIVFETNPVPASNIESMDPNNILEVILNKSPETAQMNSLIAAAQAGKFKKAFSFLSGASLGTTRSGSGSFGAMTSTGSVNFGFAYFPALEISNLNIEQLKLRKTELRYDQGQLIETTLGALYEAQIQYQQAALAERNYTEVYNAEVLRYKAGIIEIVTVLRAGNDLTQAKASRVKAETAINTLRIALHRMTLSDQFARINRCVIGQKPGGVPSTKLGRLLRPQQDLVTLDQVCRK